MTLIWRNGDMIPLADLRLDPDDRGLWLGENVFETMLWRSGEIRFLPEHRARLELGLLTLGLPLPRETDAQMQRVAGELCAANGYKDAVLRWTITGGPGPRGLAPPAVRAVNALLRAFPHTANELRPHVVSTAIPAPAAGPFTRFKHGERLAHLTALRAALDAGADEGLLFNAAGALVCASAANVFVAADGCWRTPMAGEGALPGITRGRMLAIGHFAGWPILEGTVSHAMLARADAILLTNAIAGARAVPELDGRALPPVPSALVQALAAFNS